MKFSLASSTLSGAMLAAIPSKTNAVNFIIIQPDDMAFYEDWNPPPHLPWNNNNAYPGKEYPTNSSLPWINKLRDEGLEMTQAYAASPKCGTSRYSTVTGRYATRSAHGRQKALENGKNATNPAAATIPNTKLRDVGAMNDGQDCGVSNIAQVFKANDYVTGMVGKWHLTKVNKNGGTVAGVVTEIESCGFMDAEAIYPDNLDTSATGSWSDGIHHNMEYVAYKAVEFIEANQNEDWFLYVNPTVPHGPSVLDAMDVDCRMTVDGDFTGTMPNGWSVEGMTKEFGNDCVKYRDDVKARAGTDTDDDLGSIWVDDAIGAIYKSLEKTSQLADTVILFQLDHGKVEKDKIWEGGVRIPQFIHYPAELGTAPRTFDGLVSTIDIGPTMLDFAGLDENTATGWYSMDGKSWKDAIDSSTDADDWKSNRCLFFESDTDRAVRCGCDKYMLLSATSPEAAEASSNGWWDSSTEALFDLCDKSTREYIVADPNDESPEANNILDQEPQKASDLRDMLQCHLDRTDATAAPLYQDCAATIATPSPTVTHQPTLPVAAADSVPQLIEFSPWENDILASNVATTISVTVLDDDLQRVRINVMLPDGTRTMFSVAEEVSSSGHETVHELAVDTSSQSGKYGYRLEIEDMSGNNVEIPSDGSWIEFVVADSAAELVAAARSEIADIISDAMPDVNLAAKFVRHGFHDCVGGCDGCVDMTNGDNAGLDVPIAALEPVVDMFSHFGMTRADIWVLAALQGASGSQPTDDADNVDFDMDWIGRPTCEDLNTNAECVESSCTQDRGPDRILPSPNLHTHELLEYFETEFEFDERDTVAIMGSHTLGTLSQENSGYDGANGWLGNTILLRNGYYDNIVGGSDASSTEDELIDSANWEQVFVDNENFTAPDRWEWERGNPGSHFVMVNSDIALVRDLAGEIGDGGEVSGCQFKCNRRNCALPACPHAPETLGIVAEYKFDNALWIEEFEDAFKRMLKHGSYIATDEKWAICDEAPCTVGEVARRNLRGPKN